MRIGPRYKKARRYGPELFEKTQTQKFALREGSRAGRPLRSRSDYGMELAAKQKARFFYGLSHTALRRLARECLERGASAALSPAEALFSRLETRLDNVIYRAGLAPTRAGARQLAAHGHFLVNGRRVTVPSYRLSAGDIVAVRPASAQKGWLPEKEDRPAPPAWLAYDAAARLVRVEGLPPFRPEEIPFSLEHVLQFYRR